MAIIGTGRTHGRRPWAVIERTLLSCCAERIWGTLVWDRTKWDIPPAVVFAQVAKVKTLPQLRGGDLSHAYLCEADLSGADLRSVDLRYANLFGADLSYADLSYADLSYAKLTGADLDGADFDGALLYKVIR